MPLLRIDAYQGRTPEQVKALLDGVHRAVLSAFHVPERDRYQVYQEHAAHNLVVEDTGLGIERSPNTVIISMTSRPRPVEEKQAFYAKLVEELAPCGVRPTDIIVSIVINDDVDWSFGLGRAQFLTGEL
jgi:hypothetical protein